MGQPAVMAGTVITVCLLAATSARAQSSVSFSGGGSIDPDQVYAGAAWESPDLGGGWRLRSGIDGGVGQGLRLGAINIDLLVRVPLGQPGWSLMQGGGPTIALVRYTGQAADGPGADLHAGGSYLFGFSHDNGFFAEFRVGGGGAYVPSLKIGAGWRVRIQ